MRSSGWLKWEGVNCGLHPLIHTIACETSAQDVEKKKVEPKTPHFFSLNQNIVASFQDEKCGLKYVMHIPKAEMKKKSGAEAPLCSLKNE